MPKSPKKTKKQTKSPKKQTSTPLSESSNLHTNPPPTTPRHIDFTLSLNDEGHIVDGWSSDDSFEEKIKWSRHRMRTTPGGFTPRNIQVLPPLVPCELILMVGRPTTIKFGKVTGRSRFT
jgi:hypothetical protein